MGHWISKFLGRSKRSSEVDTSKNTSKTDTGKCTEPEAPKAKLDPKDFMLVELEGQIIVREPGSIQGQQFILDRCKNCTIYLLDYSAQVMVDDCVNCRVFIGPCESSVFLRGCQDCKFVIACQQLRTVDCERIDCLLYAQTEPVIENTKNIRFGCFQYAYFALRGQFDSANLSVWSNVWSQIFDFTKEEGQQHWSALPEKITPNELIGDPCEVCENITPDELLMESVVPKTNGEALDGEYQNLFVAVFSGESSIEDVASEVVKNVTQKEIMTLIRTLQTTLKKDQLMSLFGEKDLADRGGKGPMITFHFQGKSIPEDILQEKNIFTEADSMKAKRMAETMFTELKERV
eukprot:244796_1